MHRKRANPRVRSGKTSGRSRSPSGRLSTASGAPAIDHCNPLSLGLDDQTLEYTIARKRNYVAGLQAQHLLIALEASAGTETPVEGKHQLLDIASLGPARCEPINTLTVAAMDKEHVRNLIADLVEGCPDGFSESLGLVGGCKG